MAKYWIDGLPLAAWGDGTVKYWRDGLPQNDLILVPPPDARVPPGHAKPPKPQPPGGKPGGGKESQKEIREYRWRYIRNDAQNRYIVESAAFEAFAPPEVPSFTGTGGVIADSATSGAAILEFIGSGGTISESELSALGAIEFTAAGAIVGDSEVSGSGTLEFSGAGGTSADSAVSGMGSVVLAAAQPGGSAGRKRRRKPEVFTMPEFFWSASREERQPEIVELPASEPPKPLVFTAAGGTEAASATAARGVLEFSGRIWSRSQSELSGRGSVEFIAAGRTAHGSSVAGRGEVDNTIPLEDEELLILLAA